jgi:Carboxypeptidase regulatory-like domain
MSQSPAVKWSIYLLVAIVTAGVLAFFIAPDDIAKILPYAPKPQVGNWHIKVTDMEGKMIPGSKVETYSNGKYKTLYCNKEGKITVKLDRTGGRSWVTVKAPGHVTAYGQWGRGQYTLAEVPENLEIKLEKGRVIGGKLVDMENKPIVGAKVSVRYEGEKISGEPIYQFHNNAVVQSDNNGHWKLREAPKKLKVLALSLEHPAFLAKQRTINIRKREFEKFRDFSDVRKMEPGIVVTGTVRDPDGNPVAGAYVTPGRSPWEGRRRRAIIRKTDKAGKFKFKGCEPGSSFLTVLAKGLAPEVKKVKFEKGMKAVSFRLKEGNKVTFKVVDKNKKPISGVTISLNQYKGIQSLSQLYKHVNPAKTNEKGIIEWIGAPTDPVNVYANKQGLTSASAQNVTPKDEPYELVMRLPLKITGKVVDAETGRSISSFSFIEGIRWKGNTQTHWQNHTNKTGANGTFDMTFNDGGDNRSFAVRVSAKGYFPSDSKLFTNDGSVSKLEFKLKKGVGRKGTVHNSSGEPVPNVSIAVFTADQRTQVYNGQLNNNRNGQQILTDKKGAFTLDPITSEYGIVAVHDSGIAIATQEEFEKTKVLTLKPWAKVHGRAMIGKKPAENVNLSLYNNQGYQHGKPRIGTYNNAQTDADGIFSFEKVVPGPITVARQVRMTSNGNTYHQNAYSQHSVVKPGEDKEFNIGGKGRPVIGKVIFPKGMKEKLDLRYPSYSLREIIQPKLSVQSNSNPLTSAISSLFGSKKKTPKPVIQTQQPRSYQFALKDDNTFQIDDVVPGNYQMYFHFRYQRNNNGGGRNSQAGGINKQFTIEEIPGEITEEPFDLGDMKVLSQQEQQKQQQEELKKLREKQKEALEKKKAELKKKKELEAKPKEEEELLKKPESDSGKEKVKEEKSKIEEKKEKPESKPSSKKNPEKDDSEKSKKEPASVKEEVKKEEKIKEKVKKE